MQTRRKVFGLNCDSRYEAQMSVLDMVERKTNEMLRRLDTDYVHRSPSPSFREIETPSVLREVDAYIGSKEQTEIPASSLDAVLAEDSDLNPPSNSEEGSHSKDEPLVNTVPDHAADENSRQPEEVPQEVKDVSIVDVADDSSDVPLASFVNKEEESSSSDGTLLGDLLSKSVMESLERANAKRKQLESQKEESDLEEVTVEESSDEEPIAGGVRASKDGEESNSSVDEKEVSDLLGDEKEVSDLVNEESVSNPPVSNHSIPSHVKEKTLVSETIHYDNSSQEDSHSDSSSDDDKPIGELKSVQHKTNQYISQGKSSPLPTEGERKEEKSVSPKETIQHMDSPVQESKGDEAKATSPLPEKTETSIMQQAKGPVPLPYEELQASMVKDTSVSTSTGSSIPVVVSSFSALESQPHLQSLNASPSAKPPPLSHDAIDRLFPRLPLVSTPSTTKEKQVSLQGVVCPLCLTMSDLDGK